MNINRRMNKTDLESGRGTNVLKRRSGSLASDRLIVFVLISCLSSLLTFACYSWTQILTADMVKRKIESQALISQKIAQAKAEKDRATRKKGQKPSSTSTLVETDLNKAADANSLAMKSWRTSAEETCATRKADPMSTAIQQKWEHINSPSAFAYQFTEFNKFQQSSSHQLSRCKHVFFDLGTNIGDSLRNFIDSSFVSCDDGSAVVSPSHNALTIDLDTLRLTLPQDTDTMEHPVRKWLREQMSRFGKSTEDYCAYGMEGNPVFTQRLQTLEANIMGLSPRPVRNLRIFTETVATSTDGPTQLFLDTVNTKENFWGSSIHESHQDSIKSNGTRVDVDGVTLTSFLKNNMLPFAPGATEEMKKGGHLILKMDIEGGEWLVFHEIGESGVLCDYVKMGNQVDFIVEKHYMSITDSKEREKWIQLGRVGRNKLKTCGVNFEALSGGWH